MLMSSAHPAPLFHGAMSHSHETVNFSRIRCIVFVFPSKTSVIFSGSVVGSEWRLLGSLLHPTTKHLDRLGGILVYICSSVETIVDWWQLTQGGAVCFCLCNVHQARICEWRDLRKGLLFWGIKKKKHWMDFYHYRVVVYTLPTHIYVQMWISHLMTPLI